MTGFDAHRPPWPDRPYQASIKDVARLLAVDPAVGLSASEAQARRAIYGPNLLRTRPPAHWAMILVSQLHSPVVWLLIIAAFVSALLGDWIDSLAVVAVLAINTAIGFATEWRAKRSMEALRQMTTPSVRVRREGKVGVVAAETMVPGDVVLVEAGDIIVADMRVVNVANLSSDESALTGESLPVRKALPAVAADAPLAERHSMLYKGCAITSGTGEALVVATGMATELGRITRLVDESEAERSPLEKQLDRLCRQLIWITLGVAVVVAASGLLTGHGVALMLAMAVALAVAAIPEGLPIVATLALARGMLRMARHNALMERLSAVETLGATTLIMTDKTGTLTENRMHVERVVTASGEFVFDHASGAFLAGSQPCPAAELADMARHAALCNNASLSDAGSSGDPMEVALLEMARAAGYPRKALLADYPELHEHAFDERRKMMATVHRHGERFLVAVKGAPEAVLEHVHAGDAAWAEACDRLAAQGLRVLAIAGKTVTAVDDDPYGELELSGLVAFADPPRADVKDALSEARRAGIRVVMVTGDHARTARSIAQAVGLSGDDPMVLAGAEIVRHTPQELREAVVFSRVSPEQKLDLVVLHQQAGEVVAMTGDGVNDAPALKKADIGIAMGQRGTQVAREAADMVLRDDAFSTIIHAIREGRVIYTNIRRFTVYLLSCNLSEILLIGLAMLAGLPLPLLPLQILFLNLVTDVFPALALGTIAAGRDVLDRPPRDPREPILAWPQWRTIGLHGLVIAGVSLTALAIANRIFGLAGNALTTVCFFTLALAQLWHVVNIRNWREPILRNPLIRNGYVWLAIALCLAILAMAYGLPILATVLRLTPLPGELWAIIAALSLLPVLTRELAAVAMRLHRRDGRRTIARAA